MTGEMLSQDEINALLGGLVPSEDEGTTPEEETLTPEEIDALGEIGNISMGTAATTLFALLNHKVMITTPYVEILSQEEFKQQITDDLIAVSVGYTEGLSGTNLMVLNQHDVKIIADLMMGGPGVANDEEPITELHLSAINEAMNQMIGSSSTSLSQIFTKKIDISPPEAVQMHYAREELAKILGNADPIVKISFRMQVEENIIDSQLMQVLPISFAKELVNSLYSQSTTATEATPNEVSQSSVDNNQQTHSMPSMSAPVHEPSTYTDSMNHAPSYGHSVQPMSEARPTSMMRNVEVQQPQFPDFGAPRQVYPKENMDVLMDVSLEVSVELGRTKKKIKEILEFGPGSVIELDHLAGEPVDILVNGKFIAKGEVVVIDENFGIRITDIINPENRI